MNDAVKQLINTLWFVVQDNNSELDYETRLIVLDTIAKHTGEDITSLYKKANARLIRLI